MISKIEMKVFWQKQEGKLQAERHAGWRITSVLVPYTIFPAPGFTTASLGLCIFQYIIKET